MLQKNSYQVFLQLSDKKYSGLAFRYLSPRLRTAPRLPARCGRSCAGYAAVRWAGSIQINTTDGGLRSQLLSV